MKGNYKKRNKKKKNKTEEPRKKPNVKREMHMSRNLLKILISVEEVWPLYHTKRPRKRLKQKKLRKRKRNKMLLDRLS